jgi:hypothetical protein
LAVANAPVRNGWKADIRVPPKVRLRIGMFSTFAKDSLNLVDMPAICSDLLTKASRRNSRYIKRVCALLKHGEHAKVAGKLFDESLGAELTPAF